jgi:very-short-patch-repair endonuclease
MQSQRFAFMSRQIATEAWERFGMKVLDPDEFLHPVGQSLLNLAGMRAQEEVLLDEHFRSLPPIIEFSNHRWYRDQLRIMTDVRHKRFGRPGQPVMELHHVTDGVVAFDTQENEAEAQAVTNLLVELVKIPEYSGASIGVLCLFSDQVALVQELVNDRFDEADIAEHDIVVVNPDGFQGDERDVILYSLSYDANVMPREALSARQSDLGHIQGMLNVAFTRAKDEIHVFHSAPIDAFTMASGRGVIADWLTHCAEVQARGALPPKRMGRIDSEFEADVAEALRAQGVIVSHQYPACGFEIDLLCERDGHAVALECDGEPYHHDEHGQLKPEDLDRQERLERAGYVVLRIPYRKWRKDPNAEVQKVLGALRALAAEQPDDEESEAWSPASYAEEPAPSRTRYDLNREQGAIVEALHQGMRAEADVLRFCRDRLGHGRLGPRIKESILLNAGRLARQGIIVVEDGEFFLTPDGRSADIRVVAPRPVLRQAPRGRRRAPRRRF